MLCMCVREREAKSAKPTGNEEEGPGRIVFNSAKKTPSDLVDQFLSEEKKSFHLFSLLLFLPFRFFFFLSPDVTTFLELRPTVKKDDGVKKNEKPFFDHSSNNSDTSRNHHPFLLSFRYVLSIQAS